MFIYNKHIFIKDMKPNNLLRYLLDDTINRYIKLDNS